MELFAVTFMFFFRVLFDVSLLSKGFFARHFKKFELFSTSMIQPETHVRSLVSCLR
jgi:hypothetical protein